MANDLKKRRHRGRRKIGSAKRRARRNRKG